MKTDPYVMVWEATAAGPNWLDAEFTSRPLIEIATEYVDRGHHPENLVIFQIDGNNVEADSAIYWAAWALWPGLKDDYNLGAARCEIESWTFAATLNDPNARRWRVRAKLKVVADNG